MKRNMLRLLAAVFAGTAFAALCVAQTPTQRISTSDKYVISAKAGGVNISEGTVTVVRKTGTSGRLFKGESLEIGERVSTAGDGRTEILLNPGSYVRLGQNSEFEFASTALDDLNLKLIQGSAVLEVYASKDFKVTVNTPKAKFLLIESGIYRLDVLPDGTGKIAVYEGKAQLGDANATIVKKGKQATLAGKFSQVSKFDRKIEDTLATWSRDRAKTLADATASLKNNPNVRTSLMRSFLGGIWNIYNSFGVWVRDPRGGFCFLPFGAGWGSPYGYGFGNCSCYYQLPTVIYTSTPTYYPPTVTPSAPTVIPIASSGTRTVQPPFVRMESTGFAGSGNGGGGLRGYNGGNGSNTGNVYTPQSNEPGRSSSPSYSPPSNPEPARSSPPAPSAPVPARSKDN